MAAAGGGTKASRSISSGSRILFRSLSRAIDGIQGTPVSNSTIGGAAARGGGVAGDDGDDEGGKGGEEEEGNDGDSVSVCC